MLHHFLIWNGGGMTTPDGEQSASVFREDEYHYEVLSSAQGVSGERVLIISCQCSNPTASEDVACRSAVHAAIFKGMPGDGNLPGVDALFKGNMTEKQMKYFTAFFDDGKYGDFIRKVSSVHMKISKGKKKTYYVEIPVSIDIRRLRKELEDNDIIRRLGQAFENHQNK